MNEGAREANEAQWRLSVLRLLERIADAIEAIQEVAEADAAGASRARALEEWRNGQGKHPDD